MSGVGSGGGDNDHDDDAEGPVTVRGTVRSELLFEGSRSQRSGPVLVADDGSTHRIHVVGENPFEQPTLAALDGRHVEARGTRRNGVLRVEKADLRSDGDGEGDER